MNRFILIVLLFRSFFAHPSDNNLFCWDAAKFKEDTGKVLVQQSCLEDAYSDALRTSSWVSFFKQFSDGGAQVCNDLSSIVEYGESFTERDIDAGLLKDLMRKLRQAQSEVSHIVLGLKRHRWKAEAAVDVENGRRARAFFRILGLGCCFKSNFQS